MSLNWEREFNVRPFHRSKELWPILLKRSSVLRPIKFIATLQFSVEYSDNYLTFIKATYTNLFQQFMPKLVY